MEACVRFSGFTFFRHDSFFVGWLIALSAFFFKKNPESNSKFANASGI